MRIRRAFPIALALVIVAAAVTLAVQLRKHAPPEPARLLPAPTLSCTPILCGPAKRMAGSFFPRARPGFARCRIRPIHSRNWLLTSSAIWTRRPLPSTTGELARGGTGGAASEPRFSEVFTGRLDGSRCLAYLKRTAKAVENYNSIDIFTIALYGRSFRIAILGVDTVAASNHDTPR